MKINKLSFTNKDTDWRLEPATFDQLTLLVGASGVGKTRILKSILALKNITQGRSVNGAKWLVEFSTVDKKEYKWEGEFENKGFLPENIFSFSSEGNEKDEPKIEYEKLFINNKVFIDRNPDNIYLNGTKTVKLSQNESVISLLKEEDIVKDIHTEFERITLDDNSVNSPSPHFALDDNVEAKIDKYKSLEEIRASTENNKLKLYFAYVNQKEEFNNIAESFMEVFPHVENVKIEPLISSGKKIPLFLRDVPFIQIKEKGIPNWIDETKISSGMIRTLMHISELHLCSDSSIILIDEFENSLGVNCIDELTNNILSAGRNLQFIITSHHPYIINHIHPSNWKLVSRKAGAVVAHDASDLNFDKSKHKAFTQLMNLDLYNNGADV